MFPSKQKIAAVIFDLDDTLIDWSGQEIHGAAIGQRHLRQVYAYLAAKGQPLPAEEDFLDCFGEVLVRLWQQAKLTWAGVSLAEVMTQTLQGSGLDAQRFDMTELLRVYNWQPVPGVRPYPDAIPTLQALRQQGYKLGLITNAMQPMWMRDVELETYGLLPYLDARVTSGDTGYMKPHPAIYERVLNMLAVQPAQAVFVGDRPENDIAGANAAGLTSVLISPPHLNYDLNGSQPDFTITALSELLPILARLEVSSKR
ncbi:MAG TPA: HAD family hydrolase [Chloroflexota bacterium]|nr:HAD family hydrolase [Chloroflexota bacterium]